MPQTDSSKTHPGRILVVDDDLGTVRLLRDWFSREPFEILAAENGEEGLKIARSHEPDVIVLDLTMPVMDGLTAAREIKADPITRSIPILLLTACRDLDSKLKAFETGADDYVTKPFECEEVDARIRSLLRRRNFVVGLQSKVQNLETTNDELEKLLMVDEKTGLFNFREFQRRLREEWHRAERYEVPLSLVFFDLDFFKKVNDTLGHQAGDRVLKEFAMLVTGGARANDVAARYGGEEFAVVLPHTDGEMATRVAERIRSAVKEFVFLEDEVPTRITVSAGVATYPSKPGITSVDELIRAADRALYEAKDAGRDRVIRDGEGARTR